MFVSTVILSVSGEPAYPIKVSAIGKYPYLDINYKKIDFSTLLVGKNKVKAFM